MITIITACSRPENLQRIKESINIPCEWLIVHDSENQIGIFHESWITELNVKGGVVGSWQKNLGLKYSYDSDFIYFLDDDNLMHPDFQELHLQLVKGKYLGYIFAQDLGTGFFRVPEKENIKVCHVDLAQYIINKSLFEDVQFKDVYECDGHLIEEIYKKHSEKFLVTEKVYSYYNRLTWK